MAWTPPPNWPKPPSKNWAPTPGWEPQPEWGPAPEGWNFYPKRSNWVVRHKVWSGVIAVVVLIGVIGAATSGGSGSKDKPATDDAASVVVAPTPTPHHESAKARLFDWFGNGPQTRITKMQADLKQVQRAGDDEDSQALAVACVKLRADVEKMQAYPPAPLAAFRGPFDKGMTEYARGAGNCISGAASQNAGLITAGAAQMQRGNHDIQVATANIP